MDGQQKQRSSACAYCRISTIGLGQSNENQLIPLRELALARGFELVAEYCDEGISGAKEKRPALNQMLVDARRGKFKTVLIMEFSRLGRDLRNLLNLIHELDSLGVTIISHREGVDTHSPMGKAMVALIGILAECERQWISQRIRSALYTRRLAAEASGTKFNIGRPCVTNPEIEKRILELRAEGHSIRKIHQLLDRKIGTTTIGNIVKRVAV